MLFVAAVVPASSASSESPAQLTVAVASNFRTAAQAIVGAFEAETGHRARISFASTGKLYAQIVNGAPFDLFLAADIARPVRLEQQGLIVAKSRYTYATGRLALWNPQENFIEDNASALLNGSFEHLAIANPVHAPYGSAAIEVLKKINVLQKLENKIVKGENIAQAFQFVHSRNAQLGFVAFAQISQLQESERGSYWLVPQGMHSRIDQQVVLLNDSEAARALWQFLKSETVLAILQQYGYDTPDVK